VQTWQLYRAKNGTLNQGQRMEYLMARLSLQINHAVGGDAEIGAFLRYHEQPEADINDVSKIMGVKQVNNRGK
jgi:hypothetical protein